MQEMLLENILHEGTNKKSTVKRSGTLLVKLYFDEAFLLETRLFICIML